MKIKILGLVFVAFLGSLFFLTATGFCYSEKRFLPKIEIVLRTIAIAPFKDQIATNKTEYSCSISKDPQGSGGFSDFLNLLLGRKFFEIDCVYPDKFSDNSELKFKWNKSIVNSCATKIVDSMGDHIPEKSYQHNIEVNRAIWEQK